MNGSRKQPRRDARAQTLVDIRLLVAALYQSARTLEKATGMTNAQLFVLRQLALEDGQTINELAERAMTKQSAMSLLIKRLEASGHVKRVQSKKDRRAIEVGITAAGRRVAKKAPRAPIERLLGALRRLEARDAAALKRGLDALLDAMEVRRASAPMMFEHEKRSRQAGNRSSSFSAT